MTGTSWGYYCVSQMRSLFDALFIPELSKNYFTKRLHTKTVMPCSLQSIAAAHSKRLTTTHWTENLSFLALPENKAKTKPVMDS